MNSPDIWDKKDSNDLLSIIMHVCVYKIEPIDSSRDKSE